MGGGRWTGVAGTVEGEAQGGHRRRRRWRTDGGRWTGVAGTGEGEARGRAQVAISTQESWVWQVWSPRKGRNPGVGGNLNNNKAISSGMQGHTYWADTKNDKVNNKDQARMEGTVADKIRGEEWWRKGGRWTCSVAPAA